MVVRTRRVYEPPSAEDGRRYLIDRLWPRGVAKETARVTEWLKDLAPSPELRTWYGHDPARYPTFRRRYRSELRAQSPLIDRLAEEARSGTITLLFAARDPERGNATVLAGVLEERIRHRRAGRTE